MDCGLKEESEIYFEALKHYFVELPKSYLRCVVITFSEIAEIIKLVSSLNICGINHNIIKPTLEMRLTVRERTRNSL